MKRNKKQKQHKKKKEKQIQNSTNCKNLTFKNLNTRTHYELLNKYKERVETIEYEYDEIMKMKAEGLTYEEIGIELGVNKSSITRKISRYKKLMALENSKPK